MSRKFVILILSVFLTVNAFGQNFAELEKIVESEMKEKGAVGAGVAIIKDDRAIFVKGFGAPNVEMNAPVTAKTLF